ncbi:hypothetical protein Tco_0730340 [Tanacetum coccineum]|uniref:Uncharacterized protein n=1 Tax=Tanacetum coccineum TaxID=301880 RepID=A0ABQ4YRI7_9ASTR
MESFKNAIFKQREEINDRMAEMFRLLKELTTSRTPEKVLVGEEARHPITKHVNSISLIRTKDKKSIGSNGVVGEDMVEPNKSDLTGTLKEVDGKGEVENRTNNELDGNTKEYLTGEKVRELVETPRYGYCKNLKKTVKTGQSRTRERKSTQRAGRMLSKFNGGQLKSTFSQTWST